MAISSLDVLCCRIVIGDADPANLMAINNPITLTEVKEIEINESYKKLIGTAKVVFPKGTVFKSTLLGAATLEGKDASRITAEVMQDGIIIETHLPKCSGCLHLQNRPTHQHIFRIQRGTEENV